jgi:penicillin-binding protein 1A
MAMEPQTGCIRAWVGGINYKYFKYDHVKEGKRQVGSTFKPFIYTLAMQEGYSPCFRIPNVPVTIEIPGQKAWTPKNADGKYGGMLSLKEALANSVNCISAYLMKQFGPAAVVNMAHNMGITSDLEEVPSICLGTPDLSVFEMVGAYGTLASKGLWTEPIYWTRIEDKNGIILEEKVPKRREAISEETAYLMLNLMQGVTIFGTGAGLRDPKYGIPYTTPIAGKTGTTQNFSDGWFMGITPDLVSGCWVGNEDRSVHFQNIILGQGAAMAMPIWGLFMKKVYADKSLHVSQKDFDKPKNKLTVEIDCSKYKDGNSGGNLNNEMDK